MFKPYGNTTGFSFRCKLKGLVMAFPQLPLWRGAHLRPNSCLLHTLALEATAIIHCNVQCLIMLVTGDGVASLGNHQTILSVINL